MLQLHSRNWQDFVSGFGDLEGNLWLGLDNIHRLTAAGPVELHIELEDFSNVITYAAYQNFQISDVTDFYRLSVAGHSGSSPDKLSYSDNHQFSTYDQDNDSPSWSCAQRYSCGWWFHFCSRINLNGLYSMDAMGDMQCIGIFYDANNQVCHQRAVMKLRAH